MAYTKPTEARLVYERIEELNAGGMSNADAIREVAKERGKTENAVRANQYQYRKTLGGPALGRHGARRPKSVVATADDAVARARSVLEEALAGLDGQVATAKQALDAAQARYEDAVSSVQKQKAELEAKVKALG